MTQTHRNAISGKTSLKTRRKVAAIGTGFFLPCAFAMPRIADCKNPTSFTPPKYNHIVFPCTAAQSAHKNHPKTAVDALPVLNKCLETVVDAFSALDKYSKTVVDGFSALKECQKTAVDGISSLKEHPKTTVDALSALKEHQKTVIDSILSPGGHIRHGCLRNLLNDRAVFEPVENTAKYIITQKIKRRISV